MVAVPPKHTAYGQLRQSRQLCDNFISSGPSRYVNLSVLQFVTIPVLYL